MLTRIIRRLQGVWARRSQLSQNVIKSQLISAVMGKGTAEPADLKSPLSNSTRSCEWPRDEFSSGFTICSLAFSSAQYLARLPFSVFLPSTSFFFFFWHTASIQLYFLSSVSLKGFIWISSFDVRISISVLPCVPVWLILKVIAVSGNMTNDK